MFSTVEAIWLILTLRHMFNEEIWSISLQNITLHYNFSSKLTFCSRIFRQNVYPGKWHMPGYPNIASIPSSITSACFSSESQIQYSNPPLVSAILMIDSHRHPDSPSLLYLYYCIIFGEHQCLMTL